MPTHTRVPSPIKVQVRGSRHLPLSTPRLHQGSDSPPHTGQQWPAPLSSVWPQSGALPARIRTRTRGITRDRPRCAVRSLLYPVSRCAKGRKILPLRALRNNHTRHPYVFSISDQPNMFRITLPGPGDTGEISGHEGRATETTHPENDFHLLGNLQALVPQEACPRLL